MTSHTIGLPADRIPVLRIPATPAHTNLGGDIFGGWIMSQVDIAGSIPAVLRAKGRVVTVAVNSMTFLKPVMVGDILSVYAEIGSIGNSSLRVDIEVYAQRNPVDPECIKISDAQLTYVAIDGNGRPRPVPPA
ncbi:MAG: acyl-CoA thioesterase [Gammaproteobacteria bacterium]|nr:acyl-CoA thioesterase [Gammaproteobacteria bacterium]